MVRVPVPPDPDQAGDGHGRPLLQLVKQVDHLTRQVGDLTVVKAEVEAHTRTLADLTDLLRRLGNPADTTPAGDQDADGDDAGPVMEWLTLTDARAAVRFLADLWVWVRDVFARYLPNGDGDGLPGCWPWHPVAVTELLACQATWIAATHPLAPLDGLAGWHDRWRPGTWTRVAPITSRCARDVDALHVETDGTRYSYDPAYLDELAEWWATTHTVSSRPDRPAPGLTVHRVVAPARVVTGGGS